MNDDQDPAPDPITVEIERRRAAAADLIPFIARIQDALEKGDLDLAQALSINLAEAVIRAKRPYTVKLAPVPEGASGKHYTEKQTENILRSYMGLRPKK
jgi:hypothetical protein